MHPPGKSPRYFLLPLLLGGCYLGGPVEPAKSFDGHVWHVAAEGATATVDGDAISIADDNENPILAKKCFCPAEHLLLLSVAQGLSNGGATYDFLVAELRNKAIANCKYVAYTLIGADPDSDNCEQAALNFNGGDPFNDEETCTQWNYNCPPLNEIDPYGEDEVLDEDADAGAETDTGSPLTPLDELGLHVSCSKGTCEISEELYEFALAHPAQLDENGAMLVEHSPKGKLYGFRFMTVPPDCLVDHLGFEVGDVVTKINTYALSSYANWPRILATLATATSATVTYERDSTEQTLTVRVEE